jgi:hypothetical protein
VPDTVWAAALTAKAATAAEEVMNFMLLGNDTATRAKRCECRK